jgi:hypothetical protein
VKTIAILVALCMALFGGVALYVDHANRARAAQEAKLLRAYRAEIERVQRGACRHRCLETIVRYRVDDVERRSTVAGDLGPVGELITVWAKPDFQKAYVSPEAYIGKASGAWFVVLVIPLLFLGMQFRLVYQLRSRPAIKA